MTQTESLISALTLAITASTEDLSVECSDMAASLAQGLTTEEVETCKQAALRSIAWNLYRHLSKAP